MEAIWPSAASSSGLITSEVTRGGKGEQEHSEHNSTVGSKKQNRSSSVFLKVTLREGVTTDAKENKPLLDWLQVNSRNQPVTCTGLHCSSAHHQLNCKSPHLACSSESLRSGKTASSPRNPQSPAVLPSGYKLLCGVETGLPWVRGHFLSL